jgi:Transposase C of IS166 homeodomain
MGDLPDELPSNPAELRAFAAALLERCARLERLLKLAKDVHFGRSSEKLDADQLQLVLEDIDQAVAALEAAADRTREESCRAQGQSWSVAGAFATHRRNADAGCNMQPVLQRRSR